MIISLAPALLQASNGLPSPSAGPAGDVWPFFRWGLPRADVTIPTGGLLHRRFTLTRRKKASGLFSVALSVNSLPGTAWPLASTLSFEARTFLFHRNGGKSDHV